MCNQLKGHGKLTIYLVFTALVNGLCDRTKRVHHAYATFTGEPSPYSFTCCSFTKCKADCNWWAFYFKQSCWLVAPVQPVKVLGQFQLQFCWRYSNMLKLKVLFSLSIPLVAQALKAFLPFYNLHERKASSLLCKCSLYAETLMIVLMQFSKKQQY